MSEFEVSPARETSASERLDAMPRDEMHRAAYARALDGDYSSLLAFEALNELVVLRSMGDAAEERKEVFSRSNDGLLVSDFTIAAQAKLQDARVEDRGLTYEEYVDAKRVVRLTDPPETWRYEHEGGEQRFADEIRFEALVLADYWGEDERLAPDFQMQLLRIAEQENKMDKITRVFGSA